jgi:hypothetical protein
MDRKTFEKANALDKIIRECTAILSYIEGEDTPEQNESFSKTPTIIIDRPDTPIFGQLPLPIDLNDRLIPILKIEILKHRQIAIDKLNAL